MEMLSMGPGRRSDDTVAQIADETDAEPVDLGVRSRPTVRDAGLLDPGEQDTDADAFSAQPGELGAGHWLAGLLRPEVLGVSGAALLLLIAIGMPFLTAFESVGVFVGPNEISPAWTFAPTLVAASVAGALGLAGLRQAAFHGAAMWARITSGVAAIVGVLVAIGAAMVWFAITQSDPFEMLRP